MVTASNAIRVRPVPEAIVKGEAEVHEEASENGSANNELLDLTQCIRPESIIEKLFELLGI